MIILNLLPKNKKLELGLTQLYITIKNVIILILVITILVAISLLITKAALQNHFTTVVNQSTLTTQYATSFSQGVKSFNQKMMAVEKVQADYIAWTEFLIIFYELIPEEIAIFTLDVNSSKIHITGIAQTRENLLLLKSNFEQSTLFKSIDVPLNDLLKKENLDFNLRADVNIKNF